MNIKDVEAHHLKYLGSFDRVGFFYPQFSGIHQGEYPQNHE